MGDLMSRPVCQLHGGTTTNDRGEFVCCRQEEWSAIPTELPTAKPNPPSAEVRAAIAAAVGPKGDRNG